MSFRSHDGLVECTNFADFYHWIKYNPNSNHNCPQCNNYMDMRMYASFNMHKYGKAIFICQDKNCQFYQNHIRIESTHGVPTGFEVFHTRPQPGGF